MASRKNGIRPDDAYMRAIHEAAYEADPDNVPPPPAPPDVPPPPFVVSNDELLAGPPPINDNGPPPYGETVYGTTPPPPGHLPSRLGRTALGPTPPDIAKAEADADTRDRGRSWIDTLNANELHNLNERTRANPDDLRFAKGPAEGGEVSGGRSAPAAGEPGSAPPTAAPPMGGGGGGVSMGGFKGGDFDTPARVAMKAHHQIGIAESEKAQAEGDAARKKELASDQAQAALDRTNQEYARLSQEHFNKLAQLNKEVAQGKIDPDRWTNSRTAEQRVMYFLAAAIGGFAAGFRGSDHNTAMDMMKHEIDNDIEAQKVDLENKGRAAEGERSLLAEIYNRTHNMQQSVLLTKDLAYDRIGNQLTEMAAGANSRVAMSNANLSVGQVMQWREGQREHTAEFIKGEADKIAMQGAEISAGDRRQTREIEAEDRRQDKAIEAKKDLAAQRGTVVTPQRVAAVGKELDARNITAARTALNSAKASLAKNGTAGLGVLVGTLPDFVVGAGGRENRETLGMVQGEAAKGVGRMGAVSLKYEKELLGSGIPDKINLGLRLLEQKLDAEQKNIRMRDPGAYDEFMSSGALGGGEDEDAGDDLVNGN